jgi:DNA-binding transcriptional LysR family regulator
MNVELPTLESINEFVRMGSGVALVPRISVDAELRRGDLVEVPVSDFRLDRQMRIVSREGAPMSHAGKAFLKVCEQIATSPNSRYMFQQERKLRKSGMRSAGS